MSEKQNAHSTQCDPIFFESGRNKVINEQEILHDLLTDKTLSPMK